MFKDYACSFSNSRGRLHAEKATPYRNHFERDRDRIIHSNAFKRLQYKTQVFVNHAGDHYRNRMTHSIEVSSIAKSICKVLNLCEDLSEVVALAHDLGHSPFGHAGEDALNECMQDFGGFSHNAHAFKILTLIEKKYASYNGLNLTWEVLEGVLKHNGPIENNQSYEYIFKYDEKYSLDLHNYSSAESQIAALSDDIAYICHDIEDSMRARVLSYKDLEEIEIVSKYLYEVRALYTDVNEERIIYEVLRKLTHRFIESLILQTNENLIKFNIKTEQDIRTLGHQLVQFTEPVFEEVRFIKDFLMRKVYKHHSVAAITVQSKNVVKDLFKLYVDNTELLPLDWQAMINSHNNLEFKMSLIADYIAGMTDRFAIKQYHSFYNLNFANTEL